MKKILVIEDDAQILYLFLEYLKGQRPSPAPSGTGWA